MGIIAKKSAKVSLINFVGIAIGALSLLFFQTKFLTEEHIGTLKLLNSLALLVFPFVIVGFNSAYARFSHFFETNKKEHNQFITFILFTPLALFFLYLIFYVFLFELIETSFFAESKYLKQLIYLLPAMLFHYVYIALFESFFMIKGQIVFQNFLRNIASRLYLILLITLYALEQINFETLLYLYVALHLLNVVLLSFLYFKQNSYSFTLGFNKTDQYKPVMTYTGYLIFGTISGIIVNQVDTIMTASITGSVAQVGIYTVAYFIGVVIEIPKRPISQMVIPMLSKYFETNQTNEIEKLYKQSAINLFITGSLTFILIWSNIDSIFEIIPNGMSYKSGKYVVFFIGLSKLFDLALGINFELIQYSKYYKWNMFLTPVLALLAIFTNLYFITKYGIVGAAIATAISIFIYNFIRNIIVYNKLKMNPFTYKHLITLALLILVLVIGNTIQISNPFMSILIKSILLSSIFISLVYFLNVSNEINRVILTVIKRLLRK